MGSFATLGLLESPAVEADASSDQVADAARIEAPKFKPDWEAEDKRKLEKQLREEYGHMQRILAQSDDQEKLKDIYARYTPQPATVCYLDHDSRVKLGNAKFCISEEGMTREQVIALSSVLGQHLPKTPMEIIPGKDSFGNERFAFKGISADEANAVIKMHYIKSMSEAIARGEDVQIHNADKMTTKELDFIVADMEIKRMALEKERAVGKEQQQWQVVDPAKLTAKVQEMAGGSPAAPPDSITVSPEALARVSAMSGPKKPTALDGANPTALSTPIRQETGRTSQNI